MYHLRVYYEDTDAGGVVYYANYFRYFERARTEHLRESGVDLAEYVNQEIHFVVTHLEATYKRPAVYGDLLTITTGLAELRRSTIVLEQSVYRAETLLVACRTSMASIRLTPDGPRVISIPDAIREKLRA